MTRALRLLLALWTCAVCSPGFAATGNATLRVIPYVLGPPQNVACSMGVFADDGCQSAPAPLTASFARTNVFPSGGYANTTAGTTANYMAATCNGGSTSCRPIYNVAGNGDDGYHIGFPTPLGKSSGGIACTPASVASGACIPTCTKSEATYDGTCLLDPADIALTGCTYAPGNGVIGNANAALGSVPGGGPVLNCATGWLGDLEHVNFGPVNGHGCTTLRAIPPTTVHVIVNDFFFFNDSGLCSTLGIALDVAVNDPLDTTFTNGEVNLNWDTFGDTLGPAACVAANQACNAIDAINAGFGTTVLVKYVAMYHMSYFALGTSKSIMQFDWIEGWCYRSANCHSEWYLGQGSQQNAVFDHILQLGTTVQTAGSPSPLLMTANYGTQMPALTFTKNVFINQFSGNIGAATTTVSGCIGMPPVSGSANAPGCAVGSGAIFYQTSTNVGAMGQGNTLLPGRCPNTTGGGNSVGGGVYVSIPGAYPIHTTGPDIQAEFYIDSFAPGPTGAGSYAAGSLAGGGGTFTLPSAACSNISNSAEPANFANWGNGPGHGPNPLGQLTYTDNLSDFSSGLGVGPYALTGGTTQSLWDSVSTTAALLVTPISLASGDIVYSASLSACTTSALNCPTASSATGTYPSAGTPTGVTLSSSASFGPAGVTLYVPTPITSGTISGTNLSTNGQTVTLATGDKIYDVINGTCSGAAPSTCPTVAAGGTGTSFTLTGVTGTPTAVAMTNLHQAATPTVTINNASPAAIASGSILLGVTNTTAIHFGSNSYGPFIPTPSCNYPTNNILTCPQVVSPTGANATSYTLSISGGTVGGVNSFVLAAAHSPVSCTNVSILTGNFDMANLISNATLNTITDTNNAHDQVGC